MTDIIVRYNKERVQRKNHFVSDLWWTKLFLNDFLLTFGQRIHLYVVI